MLYPHSHPTETFLLFSQTLPSHTLGFVDGKAGIVEFDIGGKTFTFKQSPGLLNSQSGSGAPQLHRHALT